jgi:hypothetical protein
MALYQVGDVQSGDFSDNFGDEGAHSHLHDYGLRR